MLPVENPTSADVIAAIHAAFDGVSRGDGVTLHEADVIDNYGSPEERAAARRLDQEPCWQAVPDEDIANLWWTLSFLDAEGFQYYLPAFMSWTVRQERGSSTNSGDSTVFHVTRLTEADSYHASRLARLDERQRRSVALFLAFMALEDDDAQRAVHGYWSQYL